MPFSIFVLRPNFSHQQPSFRWIWPYKYFGKRRNSDPGPGPTMPAALLYGEIYLAASVVSFGSSPCKMEMHVIKAGQS